MTAKFNYHSNGRRRFNINGWWPARPGRTARAVSGFLAVAVALTCTLQAFAVKPPPKKYGEAKKGEDVPTAVKRERVKLIGAESVPPKKDAAATTLEAKGPRPVIKVETPVHDFGTVWVGPKLQHTYIIKNEGKKTLKIENIRPACGCTITGKYPTTIAPGESGEFPFSTDSTRLRGKFEKGITIISNDPVMPNLRLKLRGEVKRYVEMVPPNVYFGKISKPEAQTRVLQITNNADKPLEIELAKLPKGNIDAKLVTTTPGQAYELHVTATPPFNTGILYKRISLKTNMEAQKTLNVDVRGSIPARLEVNPSILNVSAPRGQVRDLQVSTRTIKFTNYGDTPVRLLEATVDDPSIKLKVIEQREGKRYSVEVQFPPGYNVPSRGRTITLKTDDKARASIAVPVKSLASREKKAQRKPQQRQRPAEMMVGTQAPAFNVTTTEGKSLSSADLSGKITVLDFFAVNCGFCKKQIPRLETIRKEYESKGVRFATVSQTMRGKKYTNDEVIDTIKGLGFGGEIVADPDNTVGPLFKATSFPTMVVIGKTGKIEAVNIGNIGDLESRLKGQLGALLAGRPVPKPEAVAKRPERQRPERKRADELVGKSAPAFSIDTLEGKTVSNGEFGNSAVTVLDFVAPNCGYCKKQIPRVEKIRQTYADKGVRFVSVVQTMRKRYTADEVVASMDELGAKLEIAHDPENKIGRMFNAGGFPTMVVVGKSGKVEAVNVGNIGDLEKRLTGQLDALIAGKPVPKFASAQPQKRRRPAEDMAGKPTPEFSLTTLDGKAVSSDEFKNHPATVLNFFAPNCGFCKRQIPNVEKVRKEYEAKGVRFVNVAQKMRKDYTEAEIVDVLTGVGSGLELTIGDFADNKIGRQFQAVSYPTMFVVGKDGKIANVNIGAKQNLDTLLKGQLDTLLKGKP